MVVGIIVSAIIITIFFKIALKMLEEKVGWLKIFILVLVNQVILEVLWYFMNIYIPSMFFVANIISFIVGLGIYKYGFGMGWFKTLIIVIVAAFIGWLVISFLLILGIPLLIPVGPMPF